MKHEMVSMVLSRGESCKIEFGDGYTEIDIKSGSPLCNELEDNTANAAAKAHGTTRQTKYRKSSIPRFHSYHFFCVYILFCPFDMIEEA